MSAPLLVHVTTADISLELLLGPQLEAFIEAGYDVVGVSAPGPFVKRVEARGVRHVPLRNATRAMAPHKDLFAIEELRRLFCRLRPTIVHTHNPKPGLYGRLAARAAGVPVVVNTVHGLYAMPEDDWKKRAVVYSLERLASTCSDAELVQNPEDVVTLREVLREPVSKLVPLGNGIDLDRFAAPVADDTVRATVRLELGVDESTVVVGAVGRLVLEKGYVELFEAWERIRPSHPDAVLVVVGPTDADKADALPADVVARAEAAGLRYPLFVKPANLGSSVGVSKVPEPGALDAAVDLAATYDEWIVIEEGADGREIEVAVLGNEHPRASVPGEVRPASDFYDYADKYLDGSAELVIPAPLADDVADEVRALACQAFTLLRCDGMARVDFFYEEHGRGLLLNEVNTIPGFTPISMYPKLWSATGLEYGALIDELVRLALERHARRARFSVDR